MTSVMLATYPEMFAGGAVIAGLPHGSAASVQDAFECMFQGKTRSPREWGDLVRAASPHRGPWPKLSVWHGGADATVKPMNAGEIVKQWTDVHGLSPRPDQTDKVNGYPREVWHDAAGREVIESLTIPSMAHGTPLATGNGEENFGAAGPFLLEVGISSTYHIAKFWGLTDRVLHMANSDLAHVSPGGLVEVRTMSEAPESTDTGAGPDRTPSMPDWQRSLPPEISSIIDKAFKAAGLKS
jgi:feruloyl esterase